jgi:ATP-dependent RNA helicase RhlB
MANQHLTNTRFRSLELSPALVKGLDDLGFDYCTPIQAKTLPLALAGKDVAGQAQTGTGKTAAFLLATMHHLLRYTEAPPPEAGHTDPRAIILAPTRELAIQIDRDAQDLGRHTGLRSGLAYGGTGYESQRRRLEEGVDILIGTPGRTIDYFKQKVFSLRRIEVVVLDEADRMFDLGFIADLRFLLRRMPSPGQRLNMMFSATLSLRVHELAYEHMNSPEEIAIEPEQVTAERVEQVLYHVATTEKIPLLLGLLRKAANDRVLVFINTKRVAEIVGRYLGGNGFEAAVLSGDIPQKKRQRLLERFTAGELSVLVATDVAARGLHIPDVAMVVNFDLPQDPEDYVHRIGRTARAGKAGQAVSLACEEYVYSLPDIEAFIGAPIPSTPIEEAMLIEPARPEPRRPTGTSRGDGRKPGGRGRGHRGGRQSGGNEARAASNPGPQAPAADSPEPTGGDPAPGRRKRRRRPRRQPQPSPAGDS